MSSSSSLRGGSFPFLLLHFSYLIKGLGAFFSPQMAIFPGYQLKAVRQPLSVWEQSNSHSDSLSNSSKSQSLPPTLINRQLCCSSRRNLLAGLGWGWMRRCSRLLGWRAINGRVGGGQDKTRHDQSGLTKDQRFYKPYGASE